jgi:hypothetical protein
MRSKSMSEQTQIEIRDLRHKEKFQIDDRFLSGWAARVGIYAVGVYVCLCRHADKNQSCFPGIKTIAEQLNISEASTKRAINALEKFNIIKRERIGKRQSNRYYLLDKKVWKKSDSSVGAITNAEGDGSDGSQVTAPTEPLRNTHEKDTSPLSKDKGEQPEAAPEVHQLFNHFSSRCNELRGFKPEIAWGKEGKLIKEKLKRFSVEKLKDLIDKFLRSKEADELGCSLSICFANSTFNKWLEGKLQKPKKPYFRGYPMSQIFGRWRVLVDNVWKEFAGSEKEIEWR